MQSTRDTPNMHETKLVRQFLIFLLLAFANAVTAQEGQPGSAANRQSGYETGVKLSRSYNSLSLPANRRSGIPLPEDVGVFRLPLVGEIDEFGVRYAVARGGFDGLTQQAFFVDFKLPRSWRVWNDVTVAARLTVEAGRFEFGSEHRAFASIGPSIRFTSDAPRVARFVDFGISPTIIDGSIYGDKDFGTSFNLTTHVGLGLRFGRAKNQVLKFRFQHISNGGINNDNPGVNMIGLDFSFAVR